MANEPVALNLGTHLTAIDQRLQRPAQTRRLVADQQVPHAPFKLADTLTPQRLQITLRQCLAIRQLQSDSGHGDEIHL